jgi:hypothetical protein
MRGGERRRGIECEPDRGQERDREHDRPGERQRHDAQVPYSSRILWGGQ